MYICIYKIYICIYVYIYKCICIYLYLCVYICGKIYIYPGLTLTKKIRKCYTLMKQKGKFNTNRDKTRLSKFFTQKNDL